MDERYTFAHFGPLALRFAEELAALPVPLQPLRVKRWRELGFNFEGSWLRACMMSTAFVHSEQRDAHRLGQDLVENEYRRGIEAHYGSLDPMRMLDEADAKDLTLFPKLVTKIEDGAEELGRKDALWRMCRINRAHEPLIRTFGRYPYRNGAVGREDTEAETEWVQKTWRFGACEIGDGQENHGGRGCREMDAPEGRPARLM